MLTQLFEQTHTDWIAFQKKKHFNSFMRFIFHLFRKHLRITISPTRMHHLEWWCMPWQNPIEKWFDIHFFLLHANIKQICDMINYLTVKKITQIVNKLKRWCKRNRIKKHSTYSCLKEIVLLFFLLWKYLLWNRNLIFWNGFSLVYRLVRLYFFSWNLILTRIKSLLSFFCVHCNYAILIAYAINHVFFVCVWIFVTILFCFSSFFLVVMVFLYVKIEFST